MLNKIAKNYWSYPSVSVVESSESMTNSNVFSNSYFGVIWVHLNVPVNSLTKIFLKPVASCVWDNYATIYRHMKDTRKTESLNWLQLML